VTCAEQGGGPSSSSEGRATEYAVLSSNSIVLYSAGRGTRDGGFYVPYAVFLEGIYSDPLRKEHESISINLELRHFFHKKRGRGVLTTVRLYQLTSTSTSAKRSVVTDAR
jgi:hypothetical protein